MLIIKTTPHLQGISLQGDYEDLNNLYDALGRYLEFYQSHAEGFPYHEYEYLLSLNYDIRHAYMGSREYTVIDNHSDEYGVVAGMMYELPDDYKKEIRTVKANHKKGNLYYSVNILYPLVFHYLISFERILDDYYLDSWFESDENDNHPFLPYDEIKANHDRAQIRLLTSLLWDNVFELFGKEKALAAFSYFNNQEFGSTSSLYIDALLHHQACVFDHLSVEERTNYLYLAFMEIMDTEELLEDPDEFPECCQSYLDALALYLKNESNHPTKKIKEFPTQEIFHQEFQKAFMGKTGIYENEFDQFLEDLFGPMTGTDPEW